MRQGQEAVSESIFRMISRSPGVSWPSPRRFTGAALREATAKHCERCLQAKPSPVDSLSSRQATDLKNRTKAPPFDRNPQLCCLPRLAHPRSLTSVCVHGKCQQHLAIQLAGWVGTLTSTSGSRLAINATHIHARTTRLLLKKHSRANRRFFLHDSPCSRPRYPRCHSAQDCTRPQPWADGWLRPSCTRMKDMLPNKVLRIHDTLTLGLDLHVAMVP